MKTSQILTNFTGGTFSPKLYGRVDLSKYYNACRTIQNMIVYPHGGASRRLGTVYVAEAKASATISRLIPFQFNIEQAYMLEFGQEYVRFFKDNGQIVSGVTPVEIASPYTESMLADIGFAQNADTMRLVNQSVAPQMLTRSSHVDWTLADIVFTAQPAEWSAANYPGSVALYEQRGVYAGTPSLPQTMWFSATGNLDDMTTGTGADDALKLVLDDDNVILWLKIGRYLHAGTGASEWIISSGSTDEAITPTARKARIMSNYGSASRVGLGVGNAILFVQRVGRKVRELVYDYLQDNYGDPPDLTILAEHITATGIKSYVFQKEPDSILWCVLNNGTIAALTYNKSQEITAWHLHTTGTTANPGLFEDVEVIPVADHDQIWFIVRRYINGEWKRYIEYMAPDFGDNGSDCWFVDSGLKYDGDGASSVSGLDHLEGVTVSILADGAPEPNQVVTGGAITRSTLSSVVIVGIPYESILEPLDLELKIESGSAQGKRKKIHQILVRFYKTLGANVGSKEGTIDTIPFRTPGDPMGKSPPLFTGDKMVPFPGGWDRHGYIRITQSQPLPLTVLAIEPITNVNE